MLAACLVALGAPSTCAAETPLAADGQVLVKFAPGASAHERLALRRVARAELERVLDIPGWQLLRVPAGTVDDAIEELSRHNGVEQAQPNFRYTASFVPDDPYFRVLWGLENDGQDVLGLGGRAGADIGATRAWDLATGRGAPPVAVVDTGVDLSHPDLAGAAWTNPGEAGAGRAANGKDDDHDGFVDDVHGWDWVYGDGDPADEEGHGTHVAGTIAARGNNGVGVVGVAFDGTVMPLRVLDSNGSGWTSDIAQAFVYAATHGARVVNASLGGPRDDPLLEQAIADAPDTLFVVAAGNNGESTDRDPQYPCAYPEPNIICVAASDSNDRLAPFSNYGAGAVDIAAPGVGIASTWNDGGYDYMDGTSMAAPEVSGVAALVLERHPDWSAQQVRAAILGGADRVPLGAPVASRGRLDAYNAVTYGDPQQGPAQRGPSAPASRDSRAPEASLRAPSSAHLRQLLRGIRARCRSGEGGSCKAQLLMGREERRRTAIRSSVLGSAQARLARAGTATLRLRLARSVVPALGRALAHRRRVQLDLRVVVADESGNLTRLDRALAVLG